MFSPLGAPTANHLVNSEARGGRGRAKAMAANSRDFSFENKMSVKSAQQNTKK